jgi:hypothetical protein
MKTEIDFEQEQTESTERKLGPEKLWNELFSVTFACSRFIGVTSCEMTPETDFEQEPTESTEKGLELEKPWNALSTNSSFSVTSVTSCEIC